jgi:hypothetical protein
VRLIALALVALTAWPQGVPVLPPGTASSTLLTSRMLVFTVTLKPESLAASASIFGKGKDVGKWSVGVCNENDSSATIGRTRILNAAPGVHEIVGHEAEDLILRKAAADPRSKKAVIGRGLFAIAGPAVTIRGIKIKSGSMTYVGLGLSAVELLLSLMEKAAPNPTPYISDMLPAKVTLGPGQCSDETPYFVIASLVHGAATIGPVRVEVPDFAGK